MDSEDEYLSLVREIARRWRGTTTNKTKTKDLSLDKLKMDMKSFQYALAASFKGTPVKVDKDLTGNRYYIAVSQELLDQIEEQK